MLEVGVDHSVGESFTANTNTFKYTVTSQLVHNQVRIDDTWRRNEKKSVSAGNIFDGKKRGVVWCRKERKVIRTRSRSPPPSGCPPGRWPFGIWILPGDLVSLGMMQRMKWGAVERSVDIKLFNCSFCCWNNKTEKGIKTKWRLVLVGEATITGPESSSSRTSSAAEECSSLEENHRRVRHTLGKSAAM